MTTTMGRAGLLWRLAAATSRTTTTTPGPAASAAAALPPRALFSSSSAAAAAAAGPPSSSPSSPNSDPPRRSPSPRPLPFSATSGGSPFAGLAKVDLTGARFRLVDARGQVLGRLASHVASLLQGKDRPSFDPSSRSGGDVCVVINAEHAVLTGRKWEGKVYRHHTGRPGGMREETAAEAWRRGPARLVERAVAGMLPRSGAARRDRLRKLRVFDGPEHPFNASGKGALELVPSPPPPRALRDKGRGWGLPSGFEPMNPAAYARRMRGSGRRGGVAPAPASGGGDGRQPGFDDLLAAGEQAMVSSEGGAKSGGGGGGK